MTILAVQFDSEFAVTSTVKIPLSKSWVSQFATNRIKVKKQYESHFDFRRWVKKQTQSVFKVRNYVQRSWTGVWFGVPWYFVSEFSIRHFVRSSITSRFNSATETLPPTDQGPGTDTEFDEDTRIIRYSHDHTFVLPPRQRRFEV